MSSDERATKSENASTAAHPGDAPRDEDRPAPGSGLDHRQDSNSAHTEKAQAEPGEPAPPQSDPKPK